MQEDFGLGKEIARKGSDILNSTKMLISLTANN